jgi:hypothetical protein
MENAVSVVNIASRKRLSVVDRHQNYVDHMSFVAQQ